MLRHTGWLLLIAGGASAQSPGKIVSVFGPGEQTTYSVTYMGIPTGRAQITVGWTMTQFGREVWPLVCVGETSDLAAVYRVKNRFISYWDPLERQSYGADFYVQESKHRVKERYQYDLVAGEALVTREAPGWPTTQKRYPIEQGTADLAAAGFKIRNIPLQVGAVHELPIFTGAKQYKMQATVVGKESLRTGLGELEVFRVTVNGDFSGKLTTKGLMTIFYTADEKQLPVRAEAKLLLGNVRIDAVRYEPGKTYTGAE